MKNTAKKTGNDKHNFTVEVFRGEEDGGEKRESFAKRSEAIKRADYWRTFGYAVLVHDDRKCKVIYNEM